MLVQIESSHSKNTANHGLGAAAPVVGLSATHRGGLDHHCSPGATADHDSPVFSIPGSANIDITPPTSQVCGLHQPEDAMRHARDFVRCEVLSPNTFDARSFGTHVSVPHHVEATITSVNSDQDDPVLFRHAAVRDLRAALESHESLNERKGLEVAAADRPSPRSDPLVAYLRFSSENVVVPRLHRCNLQFTGEHSSWNLRFASGSVMRWSIVSLSAALFEILFASGASVIAVLQVGFAEPISIVIMVLLTTLVAAFSAAVAISALRVFDTVVESRVRCRARVYSSVLLLRFGCSLALFSTCVSEFSALNTTSWVSLTACCALHYMLAVASSCYGMHFSHFVVVAAVALVVACASFSVARPESWFIALPWLFIIVALHVRRHAVFESRLRDGFVYETTLREVQARTRSMLHAMLPPLIADQMATRELLRAVVAERNLQGSAATSSSPVFDVLPPLPPFGVEHAVSTTDPRTGQSRTEPDVALSVAINSDEDLWSEGSLLLSRGDPLVLGYRPMSKQAGRYMPALGTPHRTTSSPQQLVRTSEQNAECALGLQSQLGAGVSVASHSLAVDDGGRIARILKAADVQLSCHNAAAHRRRPSVEDIDTLGAALSLTYRQGRYHEASLLAFDLVGFTAMSQELGPQVSRRTGYRVINELSCSGVHAMSPELRSTSFMIYAMCARIAECLRTS
jgi:hypothetical protein